MAIEGIVYTVTVTAFNLFLLWLIITSVVRSVKRLYRASRAKSRRQQFKLLDGHKKDHKYKPPLKGPTDSA